MSTRVRYIAPESDTQAAIVRYLALSPLVAFAWRPNGGGARVGSPERWVWFQRALAGSESQVVCDLHGWLTTGLALAIEVKRPGEWPKVATLEDYGTRVELSRAQAKTWAQWRLMCSCWEAGGHAGVAQSVDDAMAIVERHEPVGLYGP